MAIDEDAAAAERVKLHEQPGDGAFARAAGAHERDFFARRNMKVNVLQHRHVGPGRVAEGHVLVAYVALHLGGHQAHGRF